MYETIGSIEQPGGDQALHEPGDWSTTYEVWVDERMVGALSGGKALMWVRGHNGVRVSEKADARAKTAAMVAE